MSQNPTPEEVLAQWDELGVNMSSYLHHLPIALREATKQRDEAVKARKADYARLQAQLAEAQPKLERATVCWDHETKRADEAQEKLAKADALAAAAISIRDGGSGTRSLRPLYEALAALEAMRPSSTASTADAVRRVERYGMALKWYADGSNWTREQETHGYYDPSEWTIYDSQAMLDKGSIAREALEADE